MIVSNERWRRRMIINAVMNARGTFLAEAAEFSDLDMER